MSKKLLKTPLLVLCSLLLFPLSMLAQTPQYTFTNGATGTNSIPFGGGTWASQRNQWFYAPGDFGTAPSGKAITKVYLRAGTVVNNPTTWADLKISMGQPSITGLTTTWVTGLVEVLNKSSFSPGTVTTNQWIEFVLDKPFSYDPKKPLVVQTMQSGTTGGIGFLAGGTPVNPSYTGNTQTYGAYTATTGNTRRYSYAMGIDLKALAPNNAGVSALSPTTFCAGTQNLSAVVENAGTNRIDSVRVNWSVDGVRQSTNYYKTAIDTLGNANGSTKTVALGSVSFSSGVVKTIKVWTSNPNNKNDTINDNDTLVVKLSPAISGTFTINPTGSGSSNFKTFTDAVTTMKDYGICGPVLFNVAAGTYKERVEITPVSGASATNTITFDGSGASSSPVIQNAGNATTDMNAVILNGADYVTIKGFKIENTGTTYGIGILLTNGADNNKILKNTILTPANATSAYHIGILASASTTSYTSY
ncbi:MAG: hypothetical protein ACXWEY_15655, partial [Bacteroidia bacterium]